MKKNLLTATPKWYDEHGYWKLNVQKDRIRKSFYSGTPGKKGSAECLQKAQKWLDSGLDGDPVLADAWKDWTAYKAKHVSKSALVNINGFCNKWMAGKPIMKKRLSKIISMDWQDIIDTCGETLSKVTCGMYANIINEFNRFCKDKHWLAEVPTVTASQGKAKKKQEILQPDGINVLFSNPTTKHYNKVVEEWYIHMFRFAVVTGMRRGELTGLQWEDITDGAIIINRSINKYGETTDGKTENAQRAVPLPPSAKEIIEEQREMLKRKGVVSPYIFPDETGVHADPADVSNSWRRYLKAHKLDESVTLHNLRRTMISMHKIDDMPLELLKQVVGHSATMDTFGVYGRQMDGEIKAAAGYMENAIQGVLKK